MKLASCLGLAFLLAACSSKPPKPKPGETQTLAPSPAQFMPVSGTADANDIMLFLSGKPVRHGAVLSQMQQDGSYRDYLDGISMKWRVYASRRTARQTDWSNANLAPLIGSPRTLVYPFGGPDLLHAVAMFPNTSTYVLLGLEPAGGLPALESQDPGQVLAALQRLGKSMDTQLKIGYFITKDMRGDLTGGPLPGVTPILLASIGLMNGTVEDVQGINAGGRQGIDIRFRLPDGDSRRAIYVSGDLSNGGFSGGFRSWVGGFGGSVAYFKAASYLMHDSGFTSVRDQILSQSKAIVQDDSGIPYRNFANGWDVRLFGSYEAPIELFAKHQQNDLKAAYDAIGGSGPGIPFGSGYHVRSSNANLQVALKK